MKRVIVTICVLVVCFFQPLSAQKPHSDLYHEIGVDAGPCSLVGGFINGTIGFWSGLGGALSHRPIEMKWYGNYGLHYYYQVKPWCQVGVKATVECAKTTQYTDTFRTTISSVNHDVLVALMPSVHFTYLNRPWVRLYSGLDVGCAYFWSGPTSDNGKEDENDSKMDNNFAFAFNVTAFGVNVGKKFYGLFELNAGYDSFIKVGIGARF
jgi:hypothetical protein